MYPAQVAAHGRRLRASRSGLGRLVVRVDARERDDAAGGGKGGHLVSKDEQRHANREDDLDVAKHLHARVRKRVSKRVRKRA